MRASLGVTICQGHVKSTHQLLQHSQLKLEGEKMILPVQQLGYKLKSLFQNAMQY